MSASDRLNTVEAHQNATFEKDRYRRTVASEKDDFFVNYYKISCKICAIALYD